MEDFSTQNEWVRLGIVFVIGLLVGLGVYWMIDQRNAASNGEDLTNEEMATSSIGTIVDENGLVVEDQQPGKLVKGS
jgi:hypothetical protein